jgi:Tfp pilus assembly protein PilF
MVTRDPAPLRDAIPTSEEGDALFDQLFGGDSFETPGPAAVAEPVSDDETVMLERGAGLTGAELEQETPFLLQDPMRYGRAAPAPTAPRAQLAADDSGEITAQTVAPNIPPGIPDPAPSTEEIGLDDVELLNEDTDIIPAAELERAAAEVSMVDVDAFRPSAESTVLASERVVAEAAADDAIDALQASEPPPPFATTPLMPESQMDWGEMVDALAVPSAAAAATAAVSQVTPAVALDAAEVQATEADIDEALLEAVGGEAELAADDASMLVGIEGDAPPVETVKAQPPEPRSSLDSIDVMMEEADLGDAIGDSLVELDAPARTTAEPLAPMRPTLESAEIFVDEASAQLGSEAVVALAQRGERDAWVARARWLRDEAPPAEDAPARAAVLLAVSELMAIAGEAEEAEIAAREALALQPNSNMAQRQLRTLLMSRGAWSEVADALVAEARFSATAAAEAHAAYFAAEVHRLAQGDIDGASRMLDRAERADPRDPRVVLNRWMVTLASSDEIPDGGNAGHPHPGASAGHPHPGASAGHPHPGASAGHPHPGASAGHPHPGGSPGLPKCDGADVFERAAVELRSMRSNGADGVDSKGPYGRMLTARAALRRRDPATAVGVLAEIGREPELEAAAAWLTAVIGAPHRDLAEGVGDSLARAGKGSHGALAERLRIARAFERGDDAQVLAALSTVPGEVLSAADRLTLAALLGAAPSDVAAFANEESLTADDSPLFAAATTVLDVSPGSQTSASEAGRLRMQLGRELAALRTGDARQQLETRIMPLAAALAELESDEGLLRAARLERDVAGGHVSEVASTVCAGSGHVRERAIASAIMSKLGGEAVAEMVDPFACEDEAALRIALAELDAERAAQALATLADASADDWHAAMLLTEAAHRALAAGGAQRADALWRRAHDRSGDWPIPAFFGLYGALAARDGGAAEHWLDRSELDEARRRILLALRICKDRDERASLLGDAHRANPRDFTIRDQYERAGGAADDRAAWLEGRAAEGGPDAGSCALEAAFAYELDGATSEAERALSRALELSPSPLAESLALALALSGHGVEAAIERSTSTLRQAREPAARRDAAGIIAQLEMGRGDRKAAIRWWGEAIAADPSDLLSLLECERLLFEEPPPSSPEGSSPSTLAALARIELALAKALSGDEAIAHAMLAARLLTVAQDWAASFEPLKIALAHAQGKPRLSVVRQLAAHHQSHRDHAELAHACRALAKRSEQPLERATLLVRAAEAELAVGGDAAALELVDAAIESYGSHPMAWWYRATLLERLGNLDVAAEAFEQLAGMCHSRRDRAQRLYKAAILWLSTEDQRAHREGRRLLEAVCELDSTQADAFERLQAIYLASGAKKELAQLLSQRAQVVTDVRQRGELEVLRGRMLAEAGAAGEAKTALAASLKARPDDVDAWQAYADVCAADEDWQAAEQALIQLGRLLQQPSARSSVYLRLAEIYDLYLPNAARSIMSLREASKLDPTRSDVREKLVDAQLKSGDFTAALAEQKALAEETKDATVACARLVKLAEIQEQAGNPTEAEKVLTQLRRNYPKEASPLAALFELYQRQGKPQVADTLLERAATDVRRGLAAGRLESPLIAMAVAVAQMRGQHDAASVAQATLAAIEGTPAAILGAGLPAARALHDEHLAPEVFTPAFRALLAKTGTLLDAAVPFDLRSLRVKPLAKEAELLARIRDIAAAYGIPDVEVAITASLGRTVVPASTKPPILCLGAGVLDVERPDAREFLIHRALKLIQTRTAAFARTAPIDLWPLCAAYLKLHSPSFAPVGAEPARVEEYLQRMKAAGEPRDPQLSLRASEVIGSIGNRASSLNASAGSWGSRAALLAMGDPYLALESIAWVTGNQGVPTEPVERLRWIVRQAEARDLVVFSVSDGYARLRAALGLAGGRAEMLSDSELTVEILPE